MLFVVYSQTNLLSFSFILTSLVRQFSIPLFFFFSHLSVHIVCSKDDNWRHITQILNTGHTNDNGKEETTCSPSFSFLQHVVAFHTLCILTPHTQMSAHLSFNTPFLFCLLNFFFKWAMHSTNTSIKFTNAATPSWSFITHWCARFDACSINLIHCVQSAMGTSTSIATRRREKSSLLPSRSLLSHCGCSWSLDACE